MISLHAFLPEPPFSLIAQRVAALKARRAVNVMSRE